MSDFQRREKEEKYPVDIVSRVLELPDLLSQTVSLPSKLLIRQLLGVLVRLGSLLFFYQILKKKREF